MSSIYGYTELAYAINDASARQISIRMAEDFLHRAWEMKGWEGVSEAAAEYGLNAAVDQLGNPLWYTKATIEGVTETAAELTYSTATEAAVDSVAHEVVVKEVAQVATQGATKTLLQGGLSTAVKALPVVGAIATGAGLGWESYNEHPDAWTDLSEAIFNASESPDTPLEVIARIHAGGYTTAVKEENLLKILKGLNDAGCFDYKEYDSTITQEGYQDVTWAEVGAVGNSCGLAMAKAMTDKPGWKCIMVQPDHLTSQNKWRGMVFFADPDTLPDNVNVTKLTDYSGKDVYLYSSISCYAVLADVDPDTATVSYTTYNSTYTIYSGNYQSSADTYFIGGLSVEVTEIEGDNDLFPNDHTAAVLQLPPGASLSDISDAVRDKFTDWYNDSWVQPEYDPETDSIENKRYYPITIPWWDYMNEDKDPNYDQDEAQEGDIKPETDPRSKEQAIELTELDVEDITPPYIPIEPPTPTPPFIPLDDDTSQALWSVYNPTLSELNQLGAYLWSSSIIDILQKFLQNPMDAIISLHKIFATPTTGARKNIALGYLDSGVEADTVTKQFIDVDCGSVNVPEYFADARDYDVPYTEVECYLPFIGIVRLKTADIIGGKVNIVYTIDAYSGACLCKIYVTKVGTKQLLYNFSSNCSMQIPLTGSDRTRLLSGAVAGAVAGAAVGGPVGAIAGAVGGAWKGGTSIERTSGFSANAGAMGVKKPYLIITRKYSCDAGDYNKYYGYPSNNTVTLSSCKGFTRVKSAHIENIGRATSSEKAEIETLLKQGVIIN